MALIQFTRNHNDLSTNTGFQFEFFCDRCGNGVQSEFEGSSTGMVSGALDTAANLFGGILGAAADIGNKAHSVAWEKQHDEAFKRAIAQVKGSFKQCKRCGKWVDDVCWNQTRGLCLDDAPDTEAELSAIQNDAMLEDAREKAATVDYVSADRFKQTIAATCAHCGARLTGGKFCPECGKPVAQSKFCAQCGKPVKAGVKFCPECGAAQ
ncbi:MAG: zinc ribbon domain-containing protein [Chloroflexi bacterium]|nr:zinc ribbon domain-containing protein [Chloroflexota bacterium]